MAVYPSVSTAPGKPFKNLAREDLKVSKTFIELTSLGSTFHNSDVLTPKSSLSVSTEHDGFLLNGGTVAF